MLPKAKRRKRLSWDDSDEEGSEDYSSDDDDDDDDSDSSSDGSVMEALRFAASKLKDVTRFIFEYFDFNNEKSLVSFSSVIAMKSR